MSSEQTSQSFQETVPKLNLNSKGIQDMNNVFQDILNTCPQVVDLDISNNLLTYLPNDLSGFTELQILDIRNNPFKSFEDVISSLQTLPNLINLKVDIQTQEQSVLVLNSLPKLQFLNNTSTKTEANVVAIDLDDPEITEISLDTEKPLFTEIYSFVSEKLKSISKDESDLFLHDFENLLKNEISKINNCVENNSPNYIYSTNVLDSVLNILNYFNEKYNNYLKTKDEESSNILQKINSHFFTTSLKLVNIIQKLSPKIDEEFSKLRKDYSRLNQSVEFEEMNEKIQNFQKEKDIIVKQYQDEINIYKEKIARLEAENSTMTEKLLKNAKTIINQNISKDNTISSPQEVNVNNGNIQKRCGQSTVLRKNKSSSSMNNQNVNVSSTFTPGTRIFTLKMMKDTINEIYNSKVDYDKKCDDNQLPRETMEQHMYTFLNHKYGLKTIIIEWATNIINGIRSFSTEDTEVCLFGKILRNELEEDSRLILPLLKENISKILGLILKRLYPLKNLGDINKMLKKKINSFITFDECRDVIFNLYDENDGQYLIGKVTEIINKRKSIIMSSPIEKTEKRRKKTREEMIMLEQQKEEDCNSILYKDFLKLLHDFQIRSREKYLHNFVVLFKKIDVDNNGILDESEFIQLVQSFNIYNDNLDENVSRFLSIIDPYSNKQITFSECINLFSNEAITDSNNEEISVLDKICIEEG